MIAPSGERFGPARRFAERFALIAFGLYHLPLFLNNYPSLGGGGFDDKGLAVKWGHVFTLPGIWVARHLFAMTGPMASARQGDNGDVGEEFGRLLLAVVIGVVAAVVWTIVDHRRPQERSVRDALRVLLRYSIALGLTSYGIAKILPVQFPPLSPFALDQRVGDLTPMSLLWTFMQYSRPYALLAGALEMVAVALLCFRRTATLGALVCTVVMANVAALNLAYGVPVKLYATMIVVSAAVLMSYDAPRLLAVFVKNEPAAATDLSSPLFDRMPNAARWAIKIALVGSATISSWVAMQSASNDGTPSPVEGNWVVTSFVRDSAASGASVDSGPWQRFAVQGTRLMIQTASGARMFCQRTPGPDSSMLALACARNGNGALRMTQNGKLLELKGVLGGAHTTVSARHVDQADMPLFRSNFRWITDR